MFIGAMDNLGVGLKWYEISIVIKVVNLDVEFDFMIESDSVIIIKLTILLSVQWSLLKFKWSVHNEMSARHRCTNIHAVIG